MMKISLTLPWTLHAAKPRRGNGERPATRFVTMEGTAIVLLVVEGVGAEGDLSFCKKDMRWTEEEEEKKRRRKNGKRPLARSRPKKGNSART